VASVGTEVVGGVGSVVDEHAATMRVMPTRKVVRRRVMVSLRFGVVVGAYGIRSEARHVVG
jgi:hypothetical protein